MATKRHPWNMLPGETANAFAAFCVYRDLDGKRSVAKAAKILGKNVTTMGEWSSKNGWIARAKAWDGEIDRRATEAEAREVEKMKRRQIRLAMGMQSVGRKGLLKLDPEEMTPRDVTRLLKEGTTMERVNRGEPGQIVRHEEEVDMSRLSDDDLESLHALRRKARGQ